MVNVVYGENNLMRKKTRLKKAINNDFKHEHPFHNLNESIRLAKELSIIDVIGSTSNQMFIIAEIISRLQNCHELEILVEETEEMIEA